MRRRSVMIATLALLATGCTMAGSAIKMAQYANLPPEELEKKLAELTKRFNEEARES